MAEEHEIATGNFAYGLKPHGHADRGIPNWKKKGEYSPLKCPSCEWRKSAVLDSRNRGEYQYRRRACPECGTRFTTREYFEGNPIPSVRPFPNWKREPILAEWRENVAKVIEGTML